MLPARPILRTARISLEPINSIDQTMLDALTLGQIRTFVTIAEAGSFRAAGTRLRRAQSAVSHAVAALEAELGVTLFERSSRRPSLTAEGRVLLEDARAVLLKLDTLRARAHGLGAGVELELALVVDSLFPLPLLGRVLRAWRAELPEVGLRLRVEPLGAPLAALQRGDCDLAILVGQSFQDPRVERETLMELAFVAVAAADHALARRGDDGDALPLGSAVLADHLQIVQTDPSPLSEGQDFGVLSPRTWRVGGQDAKLALIRAGIGWGRMPLWAVEQELAAGTLRRLRVPALGVDGGSPTTASLAHRIDRPLGPAGRALRAALLRQIGPRADSELRPGSI